MVYSGNGLASYGNLIIIKHSEQFISAYAHNKKLFVKEGGVVKRGEKIAELGKTGTSEAKLHFEIRYKGKPVDPIKIFTEVKLIYANMIPAAAFLPSAIKIPYVLHAALVFMGSMPMPCCAKRAIILGSGSTKDFTCGQEIIIFWPNLQYWGLW